MTSRTRTTLAAAAVAALGLLSTGPVHGQTGPAGTWSGSLTLPQGSLPLVFHIQSGDAGYTGTWDSPSQGATGVAATSVTFDGVTLVFGMANIGASFEGTLSDDGTTLEGTFSQGGATLPLTLTRGEAESPRRPQEPMGAAPYHAEEVRIDTPEVGVVLAGTLTVPEGTGPFPAAVLVSGSGPQNRNEELMGHKPFLVLADHLTRSGIAVLRYDDRGVAESTGDFATATSEDFASDALTAVRWLRRQPSVDPAAVGVIGHSEGGLIAPMVATRSDDAAFIVLLAGPGLTGAEIIRLQSGLIARAAGASQAAIDANARVMDEVAAIVRDHPDPAEAEPLLRASVEAAVRAEAPDADAATVEQQVSAQVRQLNTRWFRFFLRYDPIPTLERVRVPVLALNGEKDLQVPPAENLSAIDAALTRGGNADATVRELPGLNHLFQTAGTGSPTEYAAIEETMSPSALAAVSDWILRRFGPRR